MNNLEQTIRRILREEILTKSTNKEFNKYKDSKFYSLSEYTFQDIVDNWDELSNHRNHNIKTIKFFTISSLLYTSSCPNLTKVLNSLKAKLKNGCMYWDTLQKYRIDLLHCRRKFSPNSSLPPRLQNTAGKNEKFMKTALNTIEILIMLWMLLMRMASWKVE